MKKLLTRLVLSGALALSVAITTAPLAAPVAQAQTKFPAYTSSVQVQNLENSPALVTLTAYNPNGDIDTTLPQDTIAANDSKAYFPLGVSEGFQGAMVISSDKKVAAIANVLNSTLTAGASYVAAGEGATEVQIPLLMKDNGGFTTWYAVQNTGTGTANVSVNYSDGTSTSFQLAQNGSRVVYQSQEDHGSAKVFSAIVTADQPIVASVIEESSAVMFAYSGFTSSANSTEPVMPLINANNSGYVTGIQIQNTGNASTDVTVSYTPSSGGNNGSACTETQSISAGESKTFALLAFNNDSNGFTENCVGGAKFVGSAKVTSNTGTQPLAVIVNQLGPNNSNGEAYSGFNPSTATAQVVAPLIMDRNGGYFTSIQVQNVGTSATNVSCTFTNDPYTIPSTTLQPGEALTDLQFEKMQSAGYVGSATCNASGGGQIVAVINELNPAGADRFLVYEGINVTP